MNLFLSLIRLNQIIWYIFLFRLLLKRITVLENPCLVFTLKDSSFRKSGPV